MTRLSESKYGNKRVQEDGYTFDSGAEHRRYRELKLLEKAGEIRDLRVHPGFQLYASAPSSTRALPVAIYEADFAYWSAESKAFIIEDVKGVRTAVYNLKKKWFEAQTGLTITEIEA